MSKICLQKDIENAAFDNVAVIFDNMDTKTIVAKNCVFVHCTFMLLYSGTITFENCDFYNCHPTNNLPDNCFVIKDNRNAE